MGTSQEPAVVDEPHMLTIASVVQTSSGKTYLGIIGLNHRSFLVLVGPKPGADFTADSTSSQAAPDASNAGVLLRKASFCRVSSLGH